MKPINLAWLVLLVGQSVEPVAENGASWHWRSPVPQGLYPLSSTERR